MERVYEGCRRVEDVSTKALPFCCASTAFLSKTVPFCAVQRQQDRLAPDGQQQQQLEDGGDGSSSSSSSSGSDSGGSSDADGGGVQLEDRQAVVDTGEVDSSHGQPPTVAEMLEASSQETGGGGEKDSDSQ
eukprot:SAG22_NODE_746_length_7496_cov_5.066513_2_plen_131_part_00